MKYIYDIEMYPNLFFVLFYDIIDKKYHKFEISQFKNQKNDLAKFLAKNIIM